MVEAVEEAMKYERVELAKSFESPGFADLVQMMPGNSMDKKTKKSQWQWEEDKLLINAWLNVSMDHVIGTDQKADSFWIRVHQYCEERNPGFIKRGQTAMKKRWHRINQGALGFGGCYDQASQKIGSNSNTNNIMELAHQLFLARYQKKCNFDRHWSELRNEQKWKTPSKWRSPSIHSGGSKRTKISACGVYSSSSNPERTATEDAAVESPVCPKDTVIAKSPISGNQKRPILVTLLKKRLKQLHPLQLGNYHLKTSH